MEQAEIIQVPTRDVAGFRLQCAVHRRFFLVRHEDETGVSGEGIVAAGIVFVDGRVAMRWIPDPSSTAVYDNMEDMIAIHGHGGKTTVSYLDDIE